MFAKLDSGQPLIRGINAIFDSVTADQAPQWLLNLRKEARSRFAQLGIPSVKDEEWKYTNLAALARNSFEIAKDSGLIETAAFNKYCTIREVNVVFVNGMFSKELSDWSRIPKGITISTLQDAFSSDGPRLQSLMRKYAQEKSTAFVALNEAFGRQGVFIAAAAKTIYDQLIHIIHVTSANADKSFCAPRTVIELGAASEMSVMESHIAFDDGLVYFSNPLTDIFMQDHAVLHYCKAQKESLKAFHIGNTRIWQQGGSDFDGFSFMAGGALTRNNLEIALEAEGANTELHALYSVRNNQHVDNHTSVDHRAPNCTSNQLYKGILNHAARAVFNGKIFVQPIAQKTNSYQLNKNLLLGKDCRVDTKPQLEIFADDVKCTHGATIGQLDEDEMFYLQSRCIPRKTATQMLAHGFVDDLFSYIKSEGIRAKLNSLMVPSFEALS